METIECANYECHETFEKKNPKKRFCSLRCKNQAAYHYRLSNYKWELKLQSARWRNIQILDYLINHDNIQVNEETLNVMGFNFEACYMPFINEQDQTVLRFGNIGMQMISKTEYKLFKF